MKDGEDLEDYLATRVLDALVREDYGGLAGRVQADPPALALPGGRRIRLLTAAGTGRAAVEQGIPARACGGAGDPRSGLRPERLPPFPGFLSEVAVAPGQGLTLDEVLDTVRTVADPRDDVEAFARECRDALTATRLHWDARDQVREALRVCSLGPEPASPAGPASSGPGVAPSAGRLGVTTWYDTVAASVDHPVYPTSRARSGLSEADLRAYAPEFNPSFPLRWAGVPREAAITCGTKPGWWPDPADLGLPGDCEVFPVHPLTARLAVPAGKPSLPTGTVFADAPYLTVRPTLSMRTVMADDRTHVKVPIPVSTLGARNRRTMKPGTLPDGALVQTVLSTIADREPGHQVLIADEQSYGHAGSEMLAYVIRRFPPETGGAHVIPVAALLGTAPSGRCVIEEAAETYGSDVAGFFGTYLASLLRWNVLLFTRYGIALEAHQQNVSLLVRRDELRLLIKDNDGTLIDPVRLRAALGDAAPDPSRFADERLLTTDREALARVFVTITLHLCAGAVAFGLAARGILGLGAGLRLVREQLAAALGEHAACDGFLRARTLGADCLPTKAMVTAGTLIGKDRTGARDINKHYGPPGPNYLQKGVA